jgi:hypothetical protein
MTHALPNEFAMLEPFAAWALTSETERNRRRLASTQAEIVGFVEAMLPQVDAIAAYLDKLPAEAKLADEPERLMCLLLSLAEVAPAIEAYRAPAVVDGYESSRFAAVEGFRLRPRL